MTTTSVVHAGFVLIRSLDAPPAAVFAAFASREASDRWFTQVGQWPEADYEFDFRVGGTGHGRFSPDGKTKIFNETTYLDIVPDERIVWAYTMAVGERRISASLATVELAPEGAGTRLVYREDGAFLDGLDQVKNREEGWNSLLDALDKDLAASAAA